MTKLYIWDRLEDVTTSYHSGGGLVIVTDRGPGAAWLDYIAASKTASLSDWNDGADWDELQRDLPAASRQFDLATSEAEAVMVFEDSGCC